MFKMFMRILAVSDIHTSVIGLAPPVPLCKGTKAKILFGLYRLAGSHDVAAFFLVVLDRGKAHEWHVLPRISTSAIICIVAVGVSAQFTC